MSHGPDIIKEIYLKGAQELWWDQKSQEADVESKIFIEFYESLFVDLDFTKIDSWELAQRESFNQLHTKLMEAYSRRIKRLRPAQ